MRPRISDLYGRDVAFLGDLEPFSAQTARLPPDYAVHLIKLSALLYDHVLISGAHFWLTPVLSCIIPSIEGLIRTGAVLPVVRRRDITPDVLSYFDIRRDEGEEAKKRLVTTLSIVPALQSEIAAPSTRRLAKEINNIGSFAYINTGSIEAEYRDLWQYDLSGSADALSAYSLCFDYFGNDPSKLISTIVSLRNLVLCDYFSRGVIAQRLAALELPRALRRSLTYRASALYLQASASTCHSSLITTRLSLRGLMEHLPRDGPLLPTNLHLFEGFLEVVGIRRGALASLTGEEIAVIKASPEFQAFRALYRKLIQRLALTCDYLKWQMVDRVEKTIRGRFIRRRILEQSTRRAIYLGRKVTLEASGVFYAALSAWIGGTPDLSRMLCVWGATKVAAELVECAARLAKTPILDCEAFVKNSSFCERLRHAVGNSTE